MNRDLLLKKKYTFRADGHKLVLVKKSVESQRHVIMKALLWALYRPNYPALRVEVPIGYKYMPDLVQTSADGHQFWAEAGHVGSQKLRRLLKRFPRTHIALAIWGTALEPLETRILRDTIGVKRLAPIDIIAFPKDADRRFIDPHGDICIHHDDLNWRRIA